MATRFYRLFALPALAVLGAAPAARVGPSGKTLFLDLGAPATAVSANTVQSVSVGGAAGSFRLGAGGARTPPLPRGSTAAQVQAALAGLGPAVSTAGPPGGPWTVTWAAAGNQPLLSVDASGLLATASAPTVVDDPAGAAVGNWSVQPYLRAGEHREVLASGSGANWFRWGATLPPGRYGVSAEVGGYALLTYDWTLGVPLVPNATKAVYRLRDGGNYLGRVTADQTLGVKPRGIALDLGTWDFATGQAEVVLADDCSGVLQADGLVFTPAGAGGYTEPVAGSASYVSSGAFPSVAVNGGPPAVLGPDRLVWSPPGGPSAPLSYLAFTLPTPVKPTDTVTLTLPPGFVSTAAGPVAGATLAAENKVGSSLPPPDGGAPTALALGWNVSAPSPSPVLMYADVMKQSLPWQGPAGLAFTADGWPVFTGANQGALSPVVNGGYNANDPRGYPTALSGVWTEVVSGDASLGSGGPVADSGTTLTPLSDSDPNPAGPFVGRVRTWRVTGPRGAYSPGLAYKVTSTAPGSPVIEAHLYPPDVNASAPPKFHPAFARMCRGARTLRSCTMVGANSSGVTEYADYPTQTQRSYYAVDGLVWSANIVSAGPVPAGTPAFNASNKAPFLLTFDRPHGLVPNMPDGSHFGANVGVYPGASGDLVIPQASGAVIRCPYYNLILLYVPGLMAPNQAAVSSDSSGDPASPALPSAPGGFARRYTASVPPEDYVDLVNLVPGCDAWVNVPHGASDGLVAELFGMVGSRLNPGKRIFAEVANEHWNYGAGFSQVWYFAGLTRMSGRGDSPTPGYVDRSARVMALAARALGPRSGDLVRCYGSQAGVPGMTSQIVTQCRDSGAAIDRVLIAPYTGNQPQADAAAQPLMARTLAGLDVEQLLDFYERYELENVPAGYVAAHRAAAASVTPGVGITAYEMSLANGSLGGDAAALAAQSQAVHAHPRLAGVARHWWRSMEAAGLAEGAYFTLFGAFYGEAGYATTYPAFTATYQPAGPGDGTGPTGYDARVDLGGTPPGRADLGRAESVVGKAVADWNARLRPAPVAAPRKGGG